MHNYQVQTSKTKDAKSGYENRLTTTHEGQAVRYFAGINVGYGYRKRLLLDGKVIARVASQRGSIPLPLLAFQALAGIGIASGVAAVIHWAQAAIGGAL